MIHSYPWYISDWRESETRLSMTAEQRGIYRELIDYCFREGSLPADAETLIKVAGVTEREFSRSWPKISPHFVENNGRLWNSKVTSVLEKLGGYHEQRKAAAARSAATRRERSFQPSTSTSTSTSASPLSPNGDTADPTALLSELSAIWPENRRVSVDMAAQALCDALGTNPGTPERYTTILRNARAYLAGDDVQRGVCRRVDRWLRDGDVLRDSPPTPEPIRTINGRRMWTYEEMKKAGAV